LSNTETLDADVRRLVSDVLRVDVADLDESVALVDYGLDSLRAISLIVAVEQHFGVLIADDDAEQMTTIAEIADFLRRVRR